MCDIPVKKVDDWMPNRMSKRREISKNLTVTAGN